MTTDASSYPFPTVARLALSLYASARRVERLPTVREWLPTERVDLVPQWDSIEVYDALRLVSGLSLGGDL